MSLSILVNTSACVGAGQCALVAGEVFEQDDDGIVVLLEESPGGSQESSVRRAASLCPARAIELRG
ncbi:ferredoxin [Arthrobacter sp. M4]|uniref:ferredoxin n=1 Tax=Arthrobacter sp. M4 TaxID=218160 RepID=UPI001CDC4E4D|nr:ferredoxin [Arthrobacter sp. M4]MCA4132586.1 ferredoxin [Arthrobacter sp. M4]